MVAKEKIYVANEILEYWSPDQAKHVRVLAGEQIPEDFPQNDLEDMMGQKIIGEQEVAEPEYVEDAEK